jgi:putative ABC transport system ATP-binding protein
VDAHHLYRRSPMRPAREDTRDEIISLLENLWKGRGLTLVLVTHDSWIARRSQRVGVMQNGKLSIRQDTRRATT